MNNKPIGIIDSGVGGLAIWSEITSMLPDESTIYLADSKNCPYGNKSDYEIEVLTQRLVEFIINRGCKAVVVACNTMSVVTLKRLRAAYPKVIIIGTVPAVKKAAELTKNGRIGILGTRTTSKSRYLSQLIIKYANNHRVIARGTDKLVPFVELGEIDNISLRRILRKELALFQKEKIDTLVLACTHFPFLKDTITKLYAAPIKVIDADTAIAIRLKEVLEKNSQKNIAKAKVHHEFYTTGDLATFKNTTNSLLGRSILSTIRSIEGLDL